MPAVVAGVGTILTPTGGDDASLIQNYLDNGGVVCLSGDFLLGSGLTIRNSATILQGLGGGAIHDVGTNDGRSTLTAYGGFTGDLLTVAPTEGASNQHLSEVMVDRIGLYGAGTAARGLVIRSVFWSEFNVHVERFTDTGVYTGCVSSLGEARDCKHNILRISGRQLATGDGNILQMRGLAGGGANSCFNDVYLNGQYNNAAGLSLGDTDNNNLRVNLFRASGGSAYGVDILGGDTRGVSARANRFWWLSPGTGGVIARGTEAYTVASDNMIFAWDNENYADDPTIGTGARLVTYRDNKPLGIVGPSNRTVQTRIAQVLTVGAEPFTSSTSLGNIGVLSFPVAADGVYHFSFQGGYSVDTIGEGINLGLNFPTGAVIRGCVRKVMVGPTTEDVRTLTTVAVGTAAAGVASDTEVYAWSVEGSLLVGSTAGTLHLMTASTSASAVVRLIRGSYGIIHQVADV